MWCMRRLPTNSVMTVARKRKQTTIEDFFGTKKSTNEAPNKKGKSGATFMTITNGAAIKTETKAVAKEANTDKYPANSNAKDVYSKNLSSNLRTLLSLELETIDDSWFPHLMDEFKKPYFVKLKQFVTKEQADHTVFPPAKDIYSWTRLTPFNKVKVVIIGQDPYHNFNQAHGLAFSVKPPTPAPPSLKNIYKELKQEYPDFVEDNKVGDLTHWASQGVLLLNTSLTVRAHNANSHSKHGWETLTKRVVQLLIQDREADGKSLVFLLWGNNAIKLVESLLGSTSVGSGSKYPNIMVMKSVHPSPLSASRGFFGTNHFKMINDWLYNTRGEKMIDWSVVPGTSLREVQEANARLESESKDP
ncbi:AFH_G0040750.mRNA.1.CDS.1 [Saccharomyces cerevisiae]|nr:AFH_G0040750.mRNA.1.CDS.1 [Saccharomyces cerevisiae]CAI6835560.1 AFH_G0040750.mRNA.1.CDS.1 [Saccharomyces cerevisiae]